MTDGSTLEIVFNLANTGLKYKTAGNLAIYPENSDSLVQNFAEIQNLDLNQEFSIQENELFTGKNR